MSVKVLLLMSMMPSSEETVATVPGDSTKSTSTQTDMCEGSLDQYERSGSRQDLSLEHT